ncbi:MAG: alpha-glucosidase [Saprospiraceae bacterium]|nr:alpha-glucosidase [Saprospiraceae bacterium]
MTKSWWKEAVIYQIYPRSFLDTNGDGIGDLQGIIQKLDYLKALGVDVLWLNPIFRSPNDDNGYDISDYRDIMLEFGNMADFGQLLAGVHDRGMKLLMDLVVNHSSDEHPWFEASKDPDSPYRDYYFWQDQKPNNWQSIFGGDAWTWSEEGQGYYLHQFTTKQPDLNWENPKLREEVYALMRFWLDKGIDGFRMDVIPFISKDLPFRDAPENSRWEEVYANGPRIHEFLQEMYREALAPYDVMTVGEGPGITPDNILEYVGEDRGELNMIFHFGHMFLDFGPGGRFDPKPWKLSELKQVVQDWDEGVSTKGWINIFLDNHDFSRLVSRFGNDQEYRVASAKLLATMILTLRGTPCIYQGSEIGMTNVAFPALSDYRDVEIMNAWKAWDAAGKDLDQLLKAVHRQGRDNVRTPMQWDDTLQAGFTNGEPWIGVNPNYPEINVARALEDPSSIYYYYKHFLQFRKAHPVFVYGSYEPLLSDSETWFAYRRKDDKEDILVILNFSDFPQEFPLPDLLQGRECLITNYYGQNGDGPFKPWEGRVLR